MPNDRSRRKRVEKRKSQVSQHRKLAGNCQLRSGLHSWLLRRRVVTVGRFRTERCRELRPTGGTRRFFPPPSLVLDTGQLRAPFGLRERQLSGFVFGSAELRPALRCPPDLIRDERVLLGLRGGSSMLVSAGRRRDCSADHGRPAPRRSAPPSL